MKTEPKQVVIQVWEEDGDIQFALDTPNVEGMTQEEADEGLGAALFLIALRLHPGLRDLIKDDADA